MTRVFIDGEAGTTGLQIRERLRNRKDLTLVSVDPDRRKDPAARRDMLNSADMVILCLPDAAAREAVDMIESPDIGVIDASTAHRVKAGWVYGFPEMSADQAGAIAQARRIANPGCYPQGLIALVRPLVEAGLMPADGGAVYQAVSGYSGGGRTMIEAYERAGPTASPYMPYGLTFAHKHIPEMAYYSGLASAPLFLPAVGNYAQGMIGTVPVQLGNMGAKGRQTLRIAELHACLVARYADCRFVSVAPLDPVERTIDLDPRNLNETNFMQLHVFGDDGAGHAALVAIYDNLGKGASGAAVQNLNIMIGADQGVGLDLPAAA